MLRRVGRCLTLGLAFWGLGNLSDLLNFVDVSDLLDIVDVSDLLYALSPCGLWVAPGIEDGSHFR